ncbi:MAG: glycosyltransferase family 4 protein [Planctomycetota bacterium]|jgi:glycosyltransferase involved in cell wall biosynthesis
MRVVVAIEAHFYVIKGKAYSSYLTFESFWRRYLDVFDSVLIIARATEVESVPEGYQMVTANGIKLAALPRYHGPYQFLRKWPRIRSLIRVALRGDDAFILRVPGNISTQVWKQLPQGTPFGVEVVIDPWDAFAPGSIKSLGRPLFRCQWTHNLKKQCRQAVAASYVTEYALQQRYPPNDDAFTTHYSSVDLDSSFIIADPSKRLADIETIPKRLQGKEPPVRLGFIGSFSQGYKHPDVHINAFAKCVASGANITLNMIGDGDLLPKMKSLAERLSVRNRVKFHGRLPGGKSIMDAIDTFDLFLNATAAEGLPRVVIEAMSRGCPCIGSNVAGTPELLEQSYLVPAGEVNALTETILRVLSDPKSMAQAVKHNVQIARNYCKDVLEPRRQAFYQALRERTERYLSQGK